MQRSQKRVPPPNPLVGTVKAELKTGDGIRGWSILEEGLVYPYKCMYAKTCFPGGSYYIVTIEYWEKNVGKKEKHRTRNQHYRIHRTDGRNVLRKYSGYPEILDEVVSDFGLKENEHGRPMSDVLTRCDFVAEADEGILVAHITPPSIQTRRRRRRHLKSQRWETPLSPKSYLCRYSP